MTRIVGHTLIASPCCRTLYKRVRYGSVNFSAFEFWTDGWRDGSLMPTDGGLRRCQCGSFFLMREAIDMDLPANEDTPYPAYVQDSDLPTAINNANTKALEIVARRNYWRALNHPYRDEYRAHRDLEMAEAKAQWEAAWQEKNPDQRGTWQRWKDAIRRKTPLKPQQMPLYFAPFTVPDYAPSDIQVSNMQGLLDLLLTPDEDASTLLDNEEIAELYKALGKTEFAMEMLLKTTEKDRDKNFGAIEMSLKEGLTGPVRYKY